jgi:hypothetical protein
MQNFPKHFFLFGGVAVAIIGAATVMVLLKQSPKQTALSSSSSARPSSSVAPATTATPAKTYPLTLTTMTHMEGNFTDDKNETLFTKHVEDMRWAMDLFDEYGAKLTFESEQPFAKANTIWGTNILKDVVQAGHGVGTHADFGASPKEHLTQDELNAKFKENKTLVDDLVGAENNFGVSGGTGPGDWVLGAASAGFHYIDAVTGFGYLSMPESARPSGWTNSYIISTAYHDTIPPALSDRLYTLPLKDAKDLVADSDPALVMMNGEIGELASLDEGRSNCSPSCTFDQADVDAYVTTMKEIISMRDTSKFTRLNIHIPLTLLKASNETLLRSLLSSIKPYIDNGTAVWATQIGAYKAYEESVK